MEGLPKPGIHESKKDGSLMKVYPYDALNEGIDIEITHPDLVSFRLCFRDELAELYRDGEYEWFSELSKMDLAIDEDNKPVNNPKKTGRNEPCPCGSGKKYKRCCA